MKGLKRSASKHRASTQMNKSLSAKKIGTSFQQKRAISPSPQGNKDQKHKKYLAMNRQKLTRSLDTYTMLISSNTPIRCLQHNCNISIYCQTEQKLLCANCIFGKNQHKYHRITPIDKSLGKIQKDVEVMGRLIEREVQTMKNTADKMKGHCLIQEESDTHSGMKELIQIYEECHQQLEQNFIRSKEKIILKFEQSRIRHETKTNEINKLVQDYGLSNFMEHFSRQPYKKDDILLFQHSICCAIVSQKRFEEKDFISDKREILSLANQQKKRILGVLQTLRQLNIKNK